MIYEKNSIWTVMTLPEEEIFKTRLENLGLTTGARITFKETAPLGNPVIAVVRGTSYAFRLSALEKIGLKRNEL